MFLCLCVCVCVWGGGGGGGGGVLHRLTVHGIFEGAKLTRKYGGDNTSEIF